ncbi:MAG: MotA/TolQ/ExbB proton channel family protein [Kiritimatiellia bacterium]|jgi:biopolymer transport protein ExbB|nr:MotA/TolQ/ExbB proton channel family protein [Kiritimatiellia bacterium]MDP6847270.1 MotA/TolQ/ExbB proton channel family protein [Kiritimatiellia bacterium]
MLETIVQGKMMMIPLMVCSVLALAVFLDRLWAFYSNSKIDTRALRAQLMKHLRRGNVSDAALLCANTPGPVSAVLLTGLQSYAKLEKRTPENLRLTVGEAMEDYSLHSISAVEKRLWVLSTIGNAAPLLGMTGTVMGMIKSFEKLAEAADPAIIGIGISEALITTAAGLLIALGAVIPYSIFVSMAEDIELEIDESSSEMLEFLATGAETA